MPPRPIGILVEETSTLYLPHWVLKARAEERLRRWMPKPSSLTMSQVNEMKANDKVPGVVAVPPRDPQKQDFLFVPSLGMLSADEVRDIVGRIVEGGYGRGPQRRNISKKEWHRMVGNTVDYLVNLRLKRQTGRVVYGR